NLGELLAAYGTILVPEMNNGQLATLLRSQYCLTVQPLNKIAGQPFAIAEIETAIESALNQAGAAA
ncbi:MAG: hypothetical protein KDJ99_14185, partial [Candidatus Competibacteraceae bacterium]|nr:hypothetical protein [Candidatus Competibacteraceae bacterium]